MRLKSVLALLLTVSAGPALGADFALFAPQAPQSPTAGQASQPSDPLAAAVVQRARQALQRPPAPRETVHIEGTLPGEGIADVSRKALEDMPVARDLALAWRLTGDPAYLDQADKYLSAWATTYKVSLNPIDESRLDDLIIAYDLTEPDLPAATRSQFDALLRRLATGYLDAMETGNVPIPQTLVNNWQSQRVMLATMTAFQLGDEALIARAKAAFQRQIDINLRPDGSVTDFHMRDALHYVVVDVHPLLVAAYAAKIHGQDWYAYTTPTGATLARAVEWLVPFARGEKTHVEFVNSPVPFDRQRREAGLAGYQNANWQPGEAAQLFAIASLFDPRHVPVRDALLMLPDSSVAEPWLLLAGGPTSAGGQAPGISMMGTGLRSTDLDRSIRFYTEGLGLTVAGTHQTDMYEEAIFGFGESRNPPLILLLKFRSGKAPPPRTTEGAPEKIILAVADADALAARLKAAGYAPSDVRSSQTAGVKQFFVSDPDGNRFEITQRTARTGAR